jgi:hypothetical protein
VVAPGILHNPSVERRLGGVEPAWTLLDQPSFAALREPPPTAGAIRLIVDLTHDEFQQSAVARNTLLLRAAAAGPGLKMRATGNLSRVVAAEMRDRFLSFDVTLEDAGAPRH